MNKYQKKVHQNLRRFIRDYSTVTFVQPRKRGTYYKRENGKLISHRAVAKVVRKVMKEKQNNVIPFPTPSPVMPKKFKGFSFGKLIDLVKRGIRI